MMNRDVFSGIVWPGMWQSLLLVFSLWLPATAFSIDLSGECTGIIPAGDHLLIGGCTVPVGETLTFESGANLQGGSNVIDVSGTVNGSSFTVQNGNFVVQSGGALNLDQMTYSGIADFISYLGGSSGSVTNSNFNMVDSNSPPHVIQIDGASPNISGNTINAHSGVQVSGDGANPTIGNNDFSFKTVGVTFTDAASSGSVSSNTFNFLSSSVFSTAIHINGDASPSITSNTINNAGQDTDKGINLAINAGSSVSVSGNDICATNDDMPLIVSPDYFANSSSATISGNNLSCGWARGIGLGGTMTDSGTLAGIQGRSEFYLHAPLIISSGTSFTINGGKIKSLDFKTIVVDGALIASNATIDNTYILARAGGTMNLNRMVFTGTDYIIRYLAGSGGGLTNSQITATTSETVQFINTAPLVTGNTFSGMATGLTASSSPGSLSLNIQDNIFNSVTTGVAISGSISATISNNQFNQNTSAINLSGSDLTATISGNTFTGNDRALSFIDDAALFAASADILAGNSFAGSSDENLIGLPTTISLSGALPAIPISFKAVATLTINNPAELTIPAGSSLGFNADVGLSVSSGASLIVDGINGSPVVFTSMQGPSLWGGISVAGNAVFDYCVIEFATIGLDIADGSVPISNCRVSNNTSGMQISGASATVTASSIINNTINGISRLSGNISISQSSIFGNGGRGIYNAVTSSYITAENNNWGHISGPLDNSDDTGTGGLYNPGGLGDTVSDYVDYDPWVGKDGPIVPDAPTIGTATPADSSAWIAFTPPGNDGGSVILDYTASCDAGTDATGNSPPLEVTGLVNDATYNCYVTARNSVGTSAASASVEVTPTGESGGGEVTLPPSGDGPGEVVTYTQTATPPGGGAPVPATLSVVATEASPPESPPEADSLVSAIDISSTSSVEGYTLAVTFTIDAGSINEFTGFWKYGKEVADDAPHWYDYRTLAANGDGTGYEISGDRKSLTVHLTDGLRGDDDLEANASIVDPALPIVQVSQVIFQDSFD